ncbi:MAG: chemotaxis protein [Hyphomicrobiales bacterium]|nr:MAG: chemotaxis protein [Hyphomicrobiales bacterium]
MTDYLIAATFIPFLLIGWLAVQSLSRRFAEAHPEFGPAREEGGGCGKDCGCHGKSACQRKGH